ncbi:MAG: NUDIX hydrolase [Burkholderiaceae bacterium]|jgi:8-oxo-dGTP pyrophosphatase MutT (NUDIX family)
MARLLSCGVIVARAPGELLLCHATSRRYWDLPKGLKEPNESAAQAAARELLEETGLKIDPAELIDLGRHAYRPEKDLQVFATGTMMPSVDVASLRCSSMFVDREGRQRPEVDRYCFAPRDQLLRLCVPNMSRLLLKLDW